MGEVINMSEIQLGGTGKGMFQEIKMGTGPSVLPVAHPVSWTEGKNLGIEV